MNKQLHIILTAATVMALAAAVSCSKESALEYEGADIRFGVSTVYENGPVTKTAYSGKDQNNNSISSTSTAERIDWLSTDQIRIMCNQATSISGGDKFADYKITPGSTSGKEHKATIVPIGNGLQWGTGSHDFYALYPSTRQNSAATIAVSGSNATIKGTIPTNQDPLKLEGHVFKPDMDNAYMYAVASGITAGSKVELDFKPLVTTLEFTLLTKSGDAITSKLKSVKLSSTQSSSYLAGDFTATLIPSGLKALETSDITNGQNEITIELPDDGVQLSTTEAYTVTFLTLPMVQTELTLTLSFEDVTKRTLELKNDGNWIEVPACKKTYIWKVDAPKTVETFTYTLSATTTATNLVQAGTTQNYTVTSYKTGSKYGTKTAEAWTAEFSTDGGSTWSSTAPSWLTTFTASGTGSTSATSYSVQASKNDTASGWAGTKTVIASDKGAARDLSCYNIYGEKTGGTERSVPYNTANCYVVSAPGWYCFPCVYGNAIKGGSDNSDAYRKSKSDATSLMGAFKNHAGNAITDPWIKNNSISISAAELLWQDVQSMISDVSYTSDYIYFYVDPSYIGQGNAVIAAKNGSEIVWSWHIWVMDNPSTKLATKKVSSIVNPNEMLAMNLGYCEASSAERSVMVRFSQVSSSETAEITITQEGGTNFNNPFYQWGRKDPLYPSNGGGSIKTIYNGSGSVISAIDPAGASTVAESIKNPATFYTYASGSNYNWSTTRYDNLWNSSDEVKAVSSGEDSDVAVTKTIYDPCPPGFKVPNGHAFTGFTTTGGNTSTKNQFNASNNNDMASSKGYYFYVNPSNHSEGTIFFPASGYRNYSDGALSNVGSYGSYWTAAPYMYYTYQYGRSLSFYSSRVNPMNYSYRSLGFAVRPVQE